MDITEYKRKLESILYDLDNLGGSNALAEAQVLMLKEIALCIAGNTKELLEMRGLFVETDRTLQGIDLTLDKILNKTTTNKEEK